MMQNHFPNLLVLTLSLASSTMLGCRSNESEKPSGSAAGGPTITKGPATKLYWYLPDGMRADPELFDIFQWAQQGRLPNLKRMMERGTYGFSVPAFPSHTPTNFASLFTGAFPEVHGVNDGPMHTEGNPLGRVSVGGFSSLAKLVDPIWVTLEATHGKRVTLLSVPGSTPPELRKGITIRGRWGGWGADFHAVNFQDGSDQTARKEQGRGARLFFSGPSLASYPDKKPATGWTRPPRSFSPALEVEMAAWGASVHALLHDTSDDNQVNYDAVALSPDKTRVVATLTQGKWSEWLPVRLTWKIPDKKLERGVATSYKAKLIKLDPKGFFRLRLLFNNLNEFLTDPPGIAVELDKAVGPMVDFADNFPPQLIYFPEDKQTFLEEAEMSFEWHRKAARHVLEQHDPDVFIGNVYTPNQMLTSRWWMGGIDPASTRYAATSEIERAELWKEVHWMYEKLDDICGELLRRADDRTLVVLSSDHGAVPLNHWVRLNNLLAREGLLSFSIDPATGEPLIDWAKTKAIYLKMDGIYLDPKGLAGDWRRASGPEYNALRTRVSKLLMNLADPDGVHPVVKVVKWEDAQASLRLNKARVGDLVIANRPGYGWNEEMTGDLALFSKPRKSGYKQAIMAGEVKGMWTPFVIVGPGVKQGNFLGTTPIQMADQYPTLMHLLGAGAPSHVQGKVIQAALAGP
ncbi:MAG: alkaline phosphatase family protein [Proteobacteria bacterium]|nr:alkaline phosphatase family protein [Pseudomonadota bacterium]